MSWSWVVVGWIIFDLLYTKWAKRQAKKIFINLCGRATESDCRALLVTHRRLLSRDKDLSILDANRGISVATQQFFCVLDFYKLQWDEVVWKCNRPSFLPEQYISSLLHSPTAQGIEVRRLNFISVVCAHVLLLGPKASAQVFAGRQNICEQ